MTASTLPSPIVADTNSWRGKALIPVLIYVGLLVAIVSSLGSPLIPTIATDYHVSLGNAQWSLTLTLLVGAVTSPIVGRLGDGPRRRQVLLVALGAMVTGSVLAAVPIHEFALLLIGRGLQGVGLSLLPLAMSVARDHLDPTRARSTLATLSVTAVVGVGLGYPLTGLISEHLSFHAGFWLAAILGLIAMALSALVVPTSAHRPAQHFDMVGALALGLGLAGLLVSISEGGDWGWGSAKLIGLLVISIAIIGGWVLHELRSTMPLVDLRMMRHRTVLTANVTGLLAGIGMYMMMSMIVRYVQTPKDTGYGLAASVVVAGLVLLPLSAASFIASKLVTYVAKWVNPNRILPFGALAFAAALILFGISRSHLWEIFIAMGLGGIGIGCSFAVMPRMIVSAVPAHETSSALALNQVLRTIGYSVGSALAATILTAHTSAASEFPTNSGYTAGALIAILFCAITAVISLVLPARHSAAAPTPDADEEQLIDDNVDAAIAGLLTLENDEPVRS